MTRTSAACTATRPPLAGLGAGVAWRPALADLVADLASSSLRFSEVVAENIDPAAVPPALSDLVAGGVAVVPHGVGLGLAGADPPHPDRLRRLADLATSLRAPLVSEHVAFVRSGPGAHDAVHGDVLAGPSGSSCSSGSSCGGGGCSSS